MNIKRYISFIILVSLGFLPLSVTAQYKIKRAAIRAYKAHDYQSARTLLYKYKKTNKNPKLLYYRAISNYKCNLINRATADLIASYKLGNNDREIFWYLAKCLQSQSKYILAINKYKAFLRSDPKEEIKEEAIRNIKDCASGLRMRLLPKYGYVEGLDEYINTFSDEKHPIYSVNSNGYFYFNADIDDHINIYNASKSSDPISLFPNDSMSQNELACFDQSGKKMIYTKTFDNQKKLIANDYNPSGRNRPYDYNSPLQIINGDKDMSLFQDSILIFSSNRAGGYGGYDLYVSIFSKGRWSESLNMGKHINTKANEISPFISTNGLKIFYSSDRIGGFGKYDIYGNPFNLEEKQWGKSTNLNSPLNTSEDDLSFVISPNGEYALFSSNRKTSKGGYDIFECKLNQTEIAQHVKKGVIFTDFLTFEYK